MNPRRGLTLVELLASLTVTALLTAAALTATVSMARSELALRRRDEDQRAAGPVLEALLEADLLHAHHWRPVAEGFSVQTGARLAPRTLRLEHVPATVTYRVETVEAQCCLVRVQAAPPEAPREALVAVGVRRAELVPDKDIRANAHGWKPLPAGCEVRFTLAAKGEPERLVAIRIERGDP